jgi:hypothetical protein
MVCSSSVQALQAWEALFCRWCMAMGAAGILQAGSVCSVFWGALHVPFSF